MAVRLLRIEGDGNLIVQLPRGGELSCNYLQTSVLSVEFEPGDMVLVVPLGDGVRPVVVGRICSPEDQARTPAAVCLMAGNAIELRCGESAINLRADGKVLIKGEDVTVRAKGTQRIRAGTVSIN